VIAKSVSPNVKASAYASTVGKVSASSRLGNVVRVSVATTGLRHEKLVVEVATIAAKTGAPVDEQGLRDVAPIVAPSDPAVVDSAVWVALPRRTGRFRYRIAVVRGRRLLYETTTRAFTHGSDGASVTNVVITTNGPGIVTNAAGAVCDAVCTNSFTPGTTVVLRATAKPEGVFAGWTGACAGTGPCRFVIGRSPAQVAALFETVHTLGTSVRGRPIQAFEVGDPDAKRKVLVVGCTHGDECGGIPIAAALTEADPRNVDLWIVPNLNPDGFALGTRRNAHEVDINRNFATGWADADSAAAELDYRGPRAWSEPETVAIRNLITRLRPTITLWYYQRTTRPASSNAFPPANGIALTSGSAAIAERYRKLVDGTSIRGANPGSAGDWQKARFPGATAIFVELPYGKLPPDEVSRHVRALLAIAGGTGTG
jgi:protein MpaA